MNETLNNAETPPCFIHDVISWAFLTQQHNNEALKKFLKKNSDGY